MRRWVIPALFCSAAAGQWIHYPTEGVPRGKDGKPNLAAPAPRTRDGKPDFSGMWSTAEGLPCPPNLKDDTGDCLEKSPLSRYAPDIRNGSAWRSAIYALGRRDEKGT